MYVIAQHTAMEHGKEYQDQMDEWIIDQSV